MLRGATRWAALTGATKGIDQNGAPDVEFSFDSIGAQHFAQLTGANLQKPLAMVLDDRVISAPNDTKARSAASGNISPAISSPQDIEYLVDTLKRRLPPRAVG